jgi:hypothetical protein
MTLATFGLCLCFILVLVLIPFIWNMKEGAWDE